MKPTHPLLLLACAIATQENNPGSNPGNLAYAGQKGATCPRCHAVNFVPAKCISSAGTFPVHAIAEFTTRQFGIVALLRQLLLEIAEGQTIPGIVSQWTQNLPENHPEQYLKNVLDWTGLPDDVEVLAIIPELVKLNVPLT